MFRKGTTLLRKRIKNPVHNKLRTVILPLHVDIIQDDFWLNNHELLAMKPPQVYEWPKEMPLPDVVLQQLHLYSYKTEEKDESLVETMNDVSLEK